MEEIQFNHYSVLLDETIDALQIKPDGIYLDGTLGGGGHAWQVCSRLKTGRFYGIDQDAAAIAAAEDKPAHGFVVRSIKRVKTNKWR